MRHAALLLLALPLIAAPALASSPAAWKASDAKAKAACERVSGLRKARSSPTLLFSDEVGRTAVLVTGVYPQAHMKGRSGTMLCLYDRRTGRAETSDAPGWTAPR